ncbi:DHHC palmitoyltransferase-domain-containing protein [Mycena epipterygia]|nr:DHHC palmitoyltransferase-domain-containing protein [Mycena epipterygia]
MASSPSFPDKPSSPQLPLPPTLTSTPPNSPPRHTRQGSTSTAGGGPSSATSAMHPYPSRAEPSKSPTMPTFSPQFQHAPYSSTHAGGIQPSASFFRPSRPNQQYRPSVESASELPTDGDVYNLSSLTKHISNSSEEHSGSVGGGTAEDDYTKQRPKQSREPLLPLGSLSRPALPRERSGSSSNNGPLSPTRGGPGRLMRNSLERVFSLRRGMSFESIRKSPGASGVREGRPTFEGKRDEEHGMFDIPASPPYKTSTAPGDYPSEANHTPSASPAPSFAPPITDRDPPLAAVPMLDPDTHAPLRNYQLHPSRNRFFMGGKLLTGGDSPWAFIGCFVLAVTIAGVWFGTTAVWWWHNESPAVTIIGAYLALIVISSMLATATRDPGILPRNLDPDPPYPTTSPSDGGMRAPMPRDLKVRADVVRVKYCPTCKTYRPPRSSHCKMCDNCVDGCDHHCPWVNNCVGRRNYTTFFVLLLSATTMLVLTICTSALHLWLMTRREGLDFKGALRRGAGSAVVFCLSISVIWPVVALLSYHMRLLLLNVTTIEQIRNQAHSSLVAGPAPPNPFSHGSWRKNLLAVLCRPVGPTFLDAAGFATQDEREVNPGFVKNQ